MLQVLFGHILSVVCIEVRTVAYPEEARLTFVHLQVDIVVLAHALKHNHLHDELSDGQQQRGRGQAGFARQSSGPRQPRLRAEQVGGENQRGGKHQQRQPPWRRSAELAMGQDEVATHPEAVLHEEQLRITLDLIILVAVDGNDEVQDDDSEERCPHERQHAIHVHHDGPELHAPVLIARHVQAQRVQRAAVAEEKAAVQLQEDLRRIPILREHDEGEEKVHEDHTANQQHLLNGAAEEGFPDGEDPFPHAVKHPKHVGQVGEAKHHIHSHECLAEVRLIAVHVSLVHEHQETRPQNDRHYLDAVLCQEAGGLPQEAQDRARVAVPMLPPPG
mmetsp:Transcript_52857/g.149868  ORF Transcript_52857/g.149868 Transcript_52857/m.149868 type:complete len:332 (-) Transcript_52857:1168-2163(-)